jgi:uncharacterized protein Yka (UPF0111/DUF47 family)
MAFNSFMKLFSPKDKVFYGLFESVANNGAQMAKHLTALVSETDYNKRTAMMQPIEDLEHANDELTHRIFTELGRISLRLSTAKTYITWPARWTILPITFMPAPKR